MKKTFVILSLLFVILLPTASHAQINSDVLDKYSKPALTGEGGPYTDGGDIEQSLPQMIGSIITTVLSLLGVIMLIIVIYSGFLWLTAGGADDKVTKAKARLKNGIIGMAIILGAYLITNFVVGAVQNSINQSDQQTEQTQPS